MAAVYLARRRDNGKLVAVKAIRARYLDDPDALRRFAREARTVADLSHPNIVRTEAIEEIGDRAVAIIMEYVAGGTVRDRLVEHGVFSAEDAESVLRDVASALGYAHRRGIVHRDVKPENVFLTTAGETPCARRSPSRPIPWVRSASPPGSRRPASPRSRGRTAASGTTRSTSRTSTRIARWGSTTRKNYPRGESTTARRRREPRFPGWHVRCKRPSRADLSAPGGMR